MYPLSYPGTTLSQPEDATLRLRLSGCAWVLVVQCLVMALPVLKLLHVSSVAEWPWLGVMAPFWAPGALLLLVLAGEKLMSVSKALTK